MIRTIVTTGLMALAAIAAGPAAGKTQEETGESAAISCETAHATIDKQFVAGAYQDCTATAKDAFTLRVAPEDAGPINCSPWYAFRLTPKRKGHATVRIDYTTCGHRYWPKISTDGRRWTRLPEDAVEIVEEGDATSAIVTVPLGAKPVFVAAQEILGPDDFARWLRRIEAPDFATLSLLGQSAQGRDIEQLRIADPARSQRETVVLVGRQHPPEVTGTLAMVPFVEALLEDHPLARAYRARFETVVVPLLNPDGVVLGHWRHNTGGVDLNRDWGPFTQPETRLMDRVLRDINDDANRTLRAMIDFHSTGEDVFYTIPDDLPTDPELFTKRWLDLYQTRMPDYVVNRDARHDVGRPISKAHAYDTYGVPGVTFELGDETDRVLIWRIGREAAIAFMVTMLESPPK